MATVKQIVANRNNARKSTGPTTPTGKAVVSRNALKHGLLAKDVVVTGRFFEEDTAAYNRLRRELWESFAPVGVAEAILVDRMAACAWRFRRALKAEQGEIQISTDVGTLSRMKSRAAMGELAVKHGLGSSMTSEAGARFLLQTLDRLRQRVEEDGELTESALQEAIATVAGPDVPLMRDLAKFRTLFSQKPDSIEAKEWKNQHCQQVLSYLDERRKKLTTLSEELAEEEMEETQARLTASALPSAETLEKILRYEAALERQFYRAMNQLERLQRRRLGENVPPPLTMEVAARL